VSTARTVWLHQPWSPSADETQPSADETQRYGRATFEIHHLTSLRVRVAVRGDVDATNRHALGRFVERHTRVSKQLVLDLSEVDFFGSQGFTALYYVGIQCARRDVDWMIVGDRTVQRILRICDTEAALPVVGDLGTALGRLDRLAKHRHTAYSAG
jgi:anti-anti-sigma factor